MPLDGEAFPRPLAGGSSPYFAERIWSTRERFKAGAATIVSEAFEVMGSSDGIVGIEGIVGRDRRELPPSADQLPSPKDGMPPSPPDSEPVGCVCMWYTVSRVSPRVV